MFNSATCVSHAVTMLFQQFAALHLDASAPFPGRRVAQHLADWHTGRLQAAEELDPVKDRRIIIASVGAIPVGTGWLGAIVVGFAGATVTLGIVQLLLIVIRPLWARLLIALVFVTPAAYAGYHATHGIGQYVMPSWQLIFSIIGTVAIRANAFVHVAARERRLLQPC